MLHFVALLLLLLLKDCCFKTKEILKGEDLALHAADLGLAFVLRVAPKHKSQEVHHKV